MVERTIKPNRKKYLKEQLDKYGNRAPLSMQYTIEMNVNGNHYILMVQFWKKRVFALQAIRWWYDNNLIGGKGYRLYKENRILSALLTLLIHQFREEDERYNADIDLSQLVIDLDPYEDEDNDYEDFTD